MDRTDSDWGRIGAGLCLWLAVTAGGCKDAGSEPGADGQPTITFWTTEGYQPNEVEVLQDLARQFEKTTGTRVSIEFFVWEEINSKYLAALSAGRPPNIGQHGPDLPLRFGQEGAVRPVDDLIEAIGEDRFFPEFLDAACKYRGHYWSVPWYIEVRSLLVRKDWLEALNLKPPTTWDEWLSVCRAMTRDTDGDGTVDRWGFGLYGKDHFGQTWVAMAAQNGGGLFAEDGSITVDTPQNAEALQWYCDLYLRHRVTPPGTKSATWTDASTYYKQGVVGTLITNGYILNELQRDASDVLANSMFVPMPARRPGGRSISYLGGSHLMLFNDAPHAERAAEFVKFLMSNANYLRFLRSTAGGTLPALRDVCQDEYFQADPRRRVLVNQIHGGVRHGYRGPPEPAVGAAEGEQVFGIVVEEVLSGRKTAREALKDAQSRTERIFAQQRGGGGG